MTDDDRPTPTSPDTETAAAVPVKKPYSAPVVLHLGTFREMTASNRHSRRSDSRRSDGTN